MPLSVATLLRVAFLAILGLKFDWQAFETPGLPTPAPLPHFSEADSPVKCERGRQHTETQPRDITACALSNLDKSWTRVTPTSTVSCPDVPNVPGKQLQLDHHPLDIAEVSSQLCF